MDFFDDPFANSAVRDDAAIESQPQISQELTQDHIFYDEDDRVLHKLLSENATHFSGDASLFDGIAHAVEVECKKELDEIQNITRKALYGRENDWLGTPVLSAKAASRQLEEALFPPIINIIDTIDSTLSARLGNQKRKYYRQFVCTARSDLVLPKGRRLADRLGNAFRCGAPAFSVVERPRPLHRSALLKRCAANPVEPRHIVSYMVIKNCVFDAPSLPLGQVQGNTTLSEATEHARSLLTCLPFQLYVYGIILCGTEFWLTWTDRAGVVLSPQYSLLHRAGLRTFIRVVLRLTWELSPSALGQDPNTEYVEGHKSLKQEYNPALLVQMGLSPGSKPGSWTTWGDPVSLPHALFGRGTAVWRVWADEGHPALLKVAWAPVDRPSELEIYRRMKALIESARMTVPGVVKLDCIVGGEVHLTCTPSLNGTLHAVPMTVSALRPQNTVSPKMVDIQLHRVISTDLGKPLWKYENPEELVRAMRMALVAHRDLCALGILHRNINAGNVLIRLRPESEPAHVEKTEGFLTDFEFATLPCSDSASDDLEAPQTAAYESDDIEGTMIFLASSLLQSIKDKSPEPGGAPATIPRTKEHDIESFGWVFLFAVYAHALEDTAAQAMMPRKCSKGLEEVFERFFPTRSLRGSGRRSDAESVLYARCSLLSPIGPENIVAYVEHRVRDERHRDAFCRWYVVLADHLPTLREHAEVERPLKALVREKFGRAPRYVPPPPPPPLTHDDVLGLFDACLELIGKEA